MREGTSPERCSPPIPYCRHDLGEAEIEAVAQVLRSGWIARGPLAKQFEEACANQMHASHAVSCSNGSAALEIAVRALGIGPGDEVIVPTLTWVATASCVRLAGATPVFADIQAPHHSLDARSVEPRITDRTKAVIAVDFAGVPHDLAELKSLCDKRGLFLIQDAAHSFGAHFPDNVPVGADNTADIVTFSFHPAKSITTAEGGLLTTGSADIANRLRLIRSSGVSREHTTCRGAWDVRAEELGSNHHLTEIQAAIGLVQLERWSEFRELRREAFGKLTERLMPWREQLELPSHPAGSSHNLYIVRLASSFGGEQRGQLLDWLHQHSIRAHVHYPLLHRQPVFEASPHTSDAEFPQATAYEARALTLPLFPGISDGELGRVAATVEAGLHRLQ